MAGKTLDLRHILTQDNKATEIARKWIEWDMYRARKKADWKELRQYIYATDTTQTSNSKLPWKNKTTVPKLCQIRDNLNANYMAVLFPKRRWLKWEATELTAAAMEKSETILNYMNWVISQPSFKTEIQKIVLDYIDYGNAFIMPEWVDDTIELPNRTQTGYIGPTIRRISPLDIVFNPVAATFEQSPKIIKSIVSLGEIKKILEQVSSEENKAEYQELYNYLIELRSTAKNYAGDIQEKDGYFSMDGFTSFRQYLASDYVELLTFYGDMFDYEKKELNRNRVITVVDRHKIIADKPNDSLFGYPTIFHIGWRIRQDNLWAMGPLDNLVGMQYRIDHLENLKADILDLLAAPPLKIKGYVQDFKWAPFERINVGDDGDVEPILVPYQVLQANQEIQMYQMSMEEMAGSPKEAMGFRTPGEKTAYEVQRLENAASRIFVHKTAQMEEQGIEKALNAMLELGRRKITNVQQIPVFNEEFNSTEFISLTAADLTGSGVVRPVAARHFAERAQLVQDLTSFFSSELGKDPLIRAQFSALGLAKVFEDLLEIKDYELVKPYIRLSEEADAQRLAQVHNEQVAMEGQTPSGLTPDDSDQPLPPELVQQ